MRDLLSIKFLLLGTMSVFTACSSSDEMRVETPPPIQSQMWSAKIIASNDSINVIDDAGSSNETTRAIFIGGNNGNRFAKAWDSGDKVYAYKSGSSSAVGSLDPREADWGYPSALLNGTLTGPFSANEVLNLYSPARAIDLTGQTGSIQSMSAKTFRQGTTTVTEASDNILSLSNVGLNHRVGYARFYLTDEDGGARLHPSQLVIHSLSGPDIVLKTDENGTPIEYGDMVVNAVVYEGEYPAEPYVALYRDYDASISYTLKATVGEDIYVGPLDIEGQNAITSLPTRGGLLNYRRKMRKTTPTSTLIVAEIPNQTFTGSPIEPAVTVKDGDDALTLGTDYSVSYTNNVNVGTTAKVTITGLADALARAATKYLGTQDKTFNIVKATPVIEMDDAAMTLVNNTTQNSQTRTVTRVFIDNNGNGTWDEGTDYDITALCTVTYSTDNDAVAMVNATTGQVTAAGFGTTTITATVVEADNWLTNSTPATYTVDVKQEVNGQNSVNPWTSGGDPEGGKIFVE